MVPEEILPEEIVNDIMQNWPDGVFTTFKLKGNGFVGEYDQRGKILGFARRAYILGEENRIKKNLQTRERITHV